MFLKKEAFFMITDGHKAYSHKCSHHKDLSQDWVIIGGTGHQEGALLIWQNNHNNELRMYCLPGDVIDDDEG